MLKRILIPILFCCALNGTGLGWKALGATVLASSFVRCYNPQPQCQTHIGSRIRSQGPKGNHSISPDVAPVNRSEEGPSINHYLLNYGPQSKGFYASTDFAKLEKQSTELMLELLEVLNAPGAVSVGVGQFDARLRLSFEGQILWTGEVPRFQIYCKNVHSLGYTISLTRELGKFYFLEERELPLDQLASKQYLLPAGLQGEVDSVLLRYNIPVLFLNEKKFTTNDE